MSILSIRVDEKVKSRAMQILKKRGLDVSTAVNMYLREIIDEEEPCEFCRKYLPDSESAKGRKILARWQRESAEAVKEPGMTAAQVMDSIFGKQLKRKSIVRNNKSEVVQKVRKAADKSAERKNSK